jgi:hypothetical protein
VTHCTKLHISESDGIVFIIYDIFWFTDRLDGLAKRRKTEDKPQTLEDWLQLTDDYDRRKTTPGKKMVKLFIFITMNISFIVPNTARILCMGSDTRMHCSLAYQRSVFSH